VGEYADEETEHVREASTGRSAKQAIAIGLEGAAPA
jgi:hypothetical protein